MSKCYNFGTPDDPATNLEAAFWDFHGKNPNVYAHFDRFTNQVAFRGKKNFSADAIFHRIRWETTVETTDAGFKLSNNYCAYYARLWMRNNPAFDGFFHTRPTRADNDNVPTGQEQAA